VAEALDERFQVHGDDRLILDDEDVGRDLLGDLACRFLRQGGEFSVVEGMIAAASEGANPSTVVRRKAWRERGVRFSSLASGSSRSGALPLIGVPFQIDRKS